MADHPGLTESWNQRQAIQRRRDEEQAARDEEFERLWAGPARERQAQTNEMFNGRTLTEDEKKSRQAAWNAAAPQRREAAERRQQFRNALSESISTADRTVEHLAKRAVAQPLTDLELEQYVDAHARVAALRSLAGAIRDADEQAARRSPFMPSDPRAFGRV